MIEPKMVFHPAEFDYSLTCIINDSRIFPGKQGTIIFYVYKDSKPCTLDMDLYDEVILNSQEEKVRIK
jgi:hypothetical protein